MLHRSAWCKTRCQPCWLVGAALAFCLRRDLALPATWVEGHRQSSRVQPRRPKIDVATQVWKHHRLAPSKARPKSRCKLMFAAGALLAGCMTRVRNTDPQIALSLGMGRTSTTGCKAAAGATASSFAADIPLGFVGVLRPGHTPTRQRRSLGMAAITPNPINWRSRTKKPAARNLRHGPRYQDGVPVVPVVPHFGKYALQAVEEAWMTSRQIEKIRRILVQSMERQGKVFIRLFPHHEISQRLAESRTGAGKGNLEYWVAAVKRDFILFELDGISEDVAYRAFRQASYSLPCKVRMLKRADRASMFELEAGSEHTVRQASPKPA